MSSEQNKAIVRRFVEAAQSHGKLSAIDEYLREDFVDHNAPAGLPTDREGVKMQFTMLRTAFPDMKASNPRPGCRRGSGDHTQITARHPFR